MGGLIVHTSFEFSFVDDVDCGRVGRSDCSSMMSLGHVMVMALSTVGQVQVATPPRNILFMIVDDGGFESPVFGNSAIKTPNIAALAKQSTIFDRAYTAVSSCSPSRSAVLTGMPTHQNGMYGLHQYPGNFQSHSDVTSVPNLLNAAGYKTGIIGKHHVGPLPVYDFTYGTNATYCWAGALGDRFIDAPWSCRGEYNEMARNVTSMGERAKLFFQSIEPKKPFFLYVGWGDVHRCGYGSDIGSFCEHYGAGGKFGTIPDWPSPHQYTANEVVVPPFLPDTAAVRADLAGQYTAWTRLDAGVGVMLREVAAAGAADTTLTLFFSDNGIPFPSGKTNLQFEQGQREPLLISSPAQATRGRRSSLVVSALDLAPSMLHWARVSYPSQATAAGKRVTLTGSNLLPMLDVDAKDWRGVAFGSHQFHSLFAYYPTRSMVDRRYRLVHNVAYHLKFPILEDVAATDTWKALEAAGEAGNATGWVYDYGAYMSRPEWVLCDHIADPLCLHNLVSNHTHTPQLRLMKEQLRAWQLQTHDPWATCNPATEGTSWSDTHHEICSF